MAKHLIDTARPSAASRLKRFLRIAHQSNPHDSTKRLFRRMTARPGTRVTAFARLARTS